MNDLSIRPYRNEDEARIIDLWETCGLVVPWNNPGKDIQLKMAHTPDLFLVGEIQHQPVASCMAGYDGHRGWIYYLAVRPDQQHLGIASRIMDHAEQALIALGCPKINIMVRHSNPGVISFYEKIGFQKDPVTVLSKRLGPGAGK